MLNVIFERPVYYTLEDTYQLLSFNESIGAFKLANMQTSVTGIYTDPLNAETISFKENQKGFDYKAVEYVVSLGVSMVYNIPDWAATKLTKRDKILGVLTHQLSRIDRMLTDVREQETEHGIMLFNSEISSLCTSSLLVNGSIPNEWLIDNLKVRGFDVRPLNPEYGWDVPVVETRRGLLLFG